MTPRRVVKDASLYWVDNGACYCGAHLGMSAAYTGRDISGQPITEVTPEALAECERAGFVPACEKCGRKASRLHTVAS